jgi:hypothetical protein
MTRRSVIEKHEPPCRIGGVLGRVIMNRVILAGLITVLAFSTSASAQGPGYGRGMGGGLGLAFGPNGASIVQVLANVTGQQPAAVLASLRSGMTFSQVAEAAGHSKQQLVEAVLAERKPIVEKAVVGGRLTQAQADQLMTWMKSHIESTVDASWQPAAPGGGFGRGAGFGRGGGGYGRGMCPWVAVAPAAK